jgi:hypothetical protein
VNWKFVEQESLSEPLQANPGENGHSLDAARSEVGYLASTAMTDVVVSRLDSSTDFQLTTPVP